MWPYVAVGLGVLIIDSILDDAKSSNSSAKKAYKKSATKSKKKIVKKAKNVKRKSELDNLYKLKKAKIKVANTIYKSYENCKIDIKNLNTNINKLQFELNSLFSKRRLALSREDKYKIQKQINSVVKVKKTLHERKQELIKIKKDIYTQLQDTNNEVKSIQNSIKKLY